MQNSKPSCASLITQKKLFIFDWDGTVMDSIAQIVNSLQAAAHKLDLTLTHDAAKNIIGLGLPEAIRTLFPHHEEKWADIKDAYVKDYVINSKKTPLYEGVAELIQRLHANGKQLAVATGKSRKGLDRVLNESNLRSYFITSRGADETKSKPNPLMLEQILAETRVDVADAIMIGDTSYDMEMAQNIEMDRIAVTYGVHTPKILAKYQPIALVNNTQELSKILIG